MTQIDWYERRAELKEGQVFRSYYGIVKLDHRKPGDGTDWVVKSWCFIGSHGHWINDEDSIHPGDLIERLCDDFGGKWWEEK